MRRMTLGSQVFLSILSVALGTALVVGLFARSALSAAFDRYLASLPQMAGRMGRGRMMLGAAEQNFVSSVDRGVILAALIAVAVAAVVAVLLAAYLARPLRRLETAAEGLAEGDLGHRVEIDGPTEVAALGEAFNRMADSLEGAESLRRRMVADVAHELRNPLAAARAQAEGMMDGVIAVEPARLASLVDDLKHLSTLINDLQELAVAEAGQLRYELLPLDLAALVEAEAAHARVLLNPGVQLRVDAVGPAIVTGDGRRLSQVMRNLLSNAARHTAEGHVEVTVATVDDSVIVRVADTGEGIADDDLPHIFERFYRADSARASHTGGAGLGLAITRTIVSDHDGEVFAERSPAGGLVVGFRLPAYRAEARAD